jgi:hypothetical protein
MMFIILIILINSLLDTHLPLGLSTNNHLGSLDLATSIHDFLGFAYLAQHSYSASSDC